MYLFHESKTNLLDGFINVFISRQEPVIIWNPEVKATFDLFYESSPKVVFIEAENLTPGIIRCLETYNPRVFIFIDAFHEGPKDLYAKYAHILNRKTVLNTVKLNPIYISIYPEYLLTSWEDFGIRVESVGVGVDNLLYANCDSREVYSADVSILEDNKNYEETVKGLILEHNVKLYGRGWHMFPEGVGILDRREYGNVIMSSEQIVEFNPYNGIKSLEHYLKNSGPFETYTQIIDRIV